MQMELRPIEAKALAVLRELTEESAEHALSYLLFLQAQLKVADAKWNALFAATTDAQWDALLDEWNEGEATGIDASEDELKPMVAA